MWYWYKANKNWLLIIALLFVASVSSVLGYAQPKNPDTLAYDNIGQPDTLDPGWAFDTASDSIIQQVLEPLITYKGGSGSEFVPVLAAALPTISADGLTWTFQIRPNVKFHDGTDFTAEDVAYSFQRSLAMDRDGGGGFLYLGPLLGVSSTRDGNGKLLASVKIGGKDVALNEAICNSVTASGNTVVFHLANPVGYWSQILAHGQSHIISKKFTQAKAAELKKNEFPGCPLSADQLKAFNNPENEQNLALFSAMNGTGPFKLVSWDQAQKVVQLARNDNYWGNKPSFKNVLSKEVGEFTTRLLELKNGDADLIDAGSRANVPQILTTPGALVVDDLPGLVVNVYNFNYDIQTDKDGKNALIGSAACDGKGIPKDFWQDIHIRKGFAYSYDREKYIRDVLLNKGVAPATPDIAGLPFHNPNIKGYTFDREKARAEFGQAKCGTAADAKALNSVGFTFTVRYNAGNLARQTACNLIKTDVESFNRNFHINCEGVPFAEILNQIDSGQLPAFVLGWAPDYIDDSDYIDQWMGSAVAGAAYSGSGSRVDKLPAWGTPGKTPGGVSYTTWDDLLQKGKTSADSKVRADIYSHLQQLYVDNVVSIPVSQGVFFQAMSDKLDGWQYNPGFPSGGTFPRFDVLSKKDGAKPDVDDLCKNYPKVGFYYGPNATKKDCTNKP